MAEMSAPVRLERALPALVPHVADSSGLMIKAAAPMARFVLWADAAQAGDLSAAFGVPLPLAPCTSATHGGRAALWQGPGEWLLLAPEADEAAIEQAFAAVTVRHALTCVSHRQFGIRLEGSAARDVLAAGCPLDLSPAACPPGHCTRTLLGKVEITLWHQTADGFHLDVWRSYADYVHDFLKASIAGLPQ